MANILHVAGWFDPSGDVARSVAELNRYSDHKHEAVIKWFHPAKDVMQFPEPSGQSQDNGFVNGRFEWADAIIYHLVGWNSEAGYNFRTYNKPVAFRNANVMFAKDIGKFYCLQAFFANPMDSMYKMLASCHMGARDFMGEQTHFLPALMPVHDELYLPDWREREQCVVSIKHDKELFPMLGSQEVPWRDLSGKSHQSVMLQRKWHATVTIDNVGEGHYGLAGTESLSQGIPSIAWNHPRTLAQLEDIAPSVGSPFIQADDLSTAVKKAMKYVNYPAGVQELARHNTRNWIEKYYNSKRLIERYWEPFCDKLVRS
jgi:hypothetical protein